MRIDFCNKGDRVAKNKRSTRLTKRLQLIQQLFSNSSEPRITDLHSHNANQSNSWINQRLSSCPSHFDEQENVSAAAENIGTAKCRHSFWHLKIVIVNLSFLGRTYSQRGKCRFCLSAVINEPALSICVSIPQQETSGGFGQCVSGLRGSFQQRSRRKGASLHPSFLLCQLYSSGCCCYLFPNQPSMKTELLLASRL